MANYVYIAASLDGFIATRDGGLDWLDEIPNPGQSDYGWADFMGMIDAIVMGRITYEKVLTFGGWPYDKPVFVLSNSLENVPGGISDKVEIVRGDLTALLGQLKNRGFVNLYVDGGKVIQSFLKQDLIDEMIITRIPVLLGDGIPLFGSLSRQLVFRHVKTETLGSELVKSYYTRKKD